MQFLLDNVVAVIISGSIVLLLATLSTDSQEAAIDAVNMEAMREQQLAFVETLQRDLQNAYAVSSTFDSTSVGDTYSFHAFVVDESETIQDVRVTYVPEQVGTRDGTPIYRVRRYQGAPSPGTVGVQAGDVASGTSMATITSWSIRSRNEEGEAVVDPVNARQVHVHFEALPPIAYGQSTLATSAFTVTFRPVLLQAAGAEPTL